MMHRNPTRTIVNDKAIDSTQLGPSLISPFSYTFSIGDPNMIKQAAPQHPQGLTKLQHRLLYESDSDSSFDLTFSSPSSIGSNSEYSDVGYQSSSRSRTSSHGVSRRRGGHASRSESISSVLGSSIAIQRVLMGANPPSTSTTKSQQRQSVRAIASAFEEAGRTGALGAPKKLGSQLGRVDEVSAPISKAPQAQKAMQSTSNGALHHSAAQASSRQPTGSISTKFNDAFLGRSAAAHGPVPARLKISKQSISGPLSAPPTITTLATSTQSNSREPSPEEAQYVFPPRSSVQKRWPYDESHPRVRSFISLDGQYDEDEPAFDIVPSPSRRRAFPLPSATVPSIAPVQGSPDTPRASLGRSASAMDSPPLPSSHSAASRDSIDSTYSYDSLSGHPFSLQLPDRDPRASSSASMLDLDELDHFTSPFIGTSSPNFVNPPAAADANEVSRQPEEYSPLEPLVPPIVEAPAPLAPGSTSTLQPLLLSTSRPSSSSSSSTSTLTPSALIPVATSMRVNEDTAFPLPPSTSATKAPAPAAAASSSAFSKFRNRLVGGGKNPSKSPVSGAPTRTLDLGSESGADQTLAVAELQREARALLDSIRALGDEIDSSIPATHRLPGSACRTATASSAGSSGSSTSCSDASADEGTPSFVAVDASYSDTWRLMDAWYWSSFELTPAQADSS